MGMDQQREVLLAEHGDALRKSSFVPDAAQLVEHKLVDEDAQHGEGEKHPGTVLAEEKERNSLVPLDAHEEERKVSQRKVSNASAAEQLRAISEMQHADHDASEERKTNRQSAIEAMDKEREEKLAEHGDAMRKVPSVPDPTQLADVVPKD